MKSCKYPIQLTMFLLSHFCLFTTIISQSNATLFTNYSIKDGLAGNTVYSAIQDKEGFMWFATDRGISRFDGKIFKNYTVADGLPDNEILRIFCDSKGRIWMSPFHNSICYYYKGRIFNTQNDSVLKKIKIIGNCYNIIESKDGKILIHDTKGLHIINVDNKVISLINEKYNFREIFKSTKYDCFIQETMNNVIYKLENNKIEPYCSTKLNTLVRTIITDSLHVYLGSKFATSTVPSLIVMDARTNKVHLNLQENKNEILEQFDSTFYFIHNNRLESFLYSNNKVIQLPTQLFDFEINRVFFDNQDNMYLLTKSKGFFRKKISNTQNISFAKHNTSERGSLLINNENTFNFITNNGTVYYWNENKLIDRNINEGLIRFYKKINNHRELIGLTHGFFYRDHKKKYTIISKSPVKDIKECNYHYLSITYDNLLLINKFNFSIEDTLWKSRVTAGNYVNGKYYIGTKEGLYCLDEKTKNYDTLSKKYPIFSKRVSFIEIDRAGNVWVGLSSNGLALLKKNKLVAHYTTNEGLPSNYLKKAYCNHDAIWIGTDNGIAKIDITNFPHKIVKVFTKEIGLVNDNINDIFVLKDSVFIATDDGFSYFKENEIKTKDSIQFVITSISSLKNPVFTIEESIILDRDDNNLRIEYSVIDHSTENNPTFYYKLNSTKQNWTLTKDNFISFQNLLPGKYQLEIYATNNLGQKSKTYIIQFEIKKYFYETNFARIVSIALLGLIIYFFVKKRIAKIKFENNVKQEIIQKMNELEQQALKAQMNPHFIFNSLNTVQHFIIKNDVYGANNYISTFSKLIRKTLDFSFQKEISLAEEIDYLKKYLSIESTRFENKIHYNIEVTVSNIENILIPPLLLQTVLENSIKHNLSSTQILEIKIIFSIVHDCLQIIIEDNGKGIQKEGHSIDRKNSVSGLEILKNRLFILNKTHHTEKYNFEITNKRDYSTQNGTLVKISLPLKYHI